MSHYHLHSEAPSSMIQLHQPITHFPTNKLFSRQIKHSVDEATKLFLFDIYHDHYRQASFSSSTHFILKF